jgi:hypothetical protein
VNVAIPFVGMNSESEALENAPLGFDILTNEVMDTEPVEFKEEHTRRCATSLALPSNTSVIGTTLDSFFEKCLSEDTEAPCSAWGEDSGFSVSDIENLARSSNESTDTAQAPVVYLMANRPRARLHVVQHESTFQPDCPPTSMDTLFCSLLQPLTTSIDSSSMAAYAVRLVERECALDVVKRCSKREILEEYISETCPICLESLEKNQQVKILPCSHTLHGWCCTRYFRTSGVKAMCPVCRFDMKDEKFVQ